MSIVFTVFSVLFGAACIGFIAGRCYEHGLMKRQLNEAADEGYRQGLARGRNECKAVQAGQLQYRSLSRPRVKLYDPAQDGRRMRAGECAMTGGAGS